MKITELLIESANDSKVDLIDMLREFLPFVVDKLEIKTLPQINLLAQIPDKEQPTFGRYDQDARSLSLAIINRHPLDILRTLAHELAHHVQNTENRLGPHSGDTGSDEENEAHELAGIVMREFNKMHPEYFNTHTVEIPQPK
jgi:hypothetical protein